MRTIQRNKRTIYYALYSGITEVVDDEGNYTGEQTVSYGEVVTARMNVSGGRGQAEIELFGVDNPFTRTAVTDDMTTAFDTDTIFWFEADPTTEPHNYRCTGVAKTINQVVIALAEVDIQTDPEHPTPPTPDPDPDPDPDDPDDPTDPDEEGLTDEDNND